MRRGCSARTSSGRTGGWQDARGGPRVPEKHATLCTPCTLCTPRSPLPAPQLRVGLAGTEPGETAVQRRWFRAPSLQNFPLLLAPAISRKSRSWGAGGGCGCGLAGRGCCWNTRGQQHVRVRARLCVCQHVRVCSGACASMGRYIYLKTCICAFPSRHCTPVRLQHPFAAAFLSVCSLMSRHSRVN